MSKFQLYKLIVILTFLAVFFQSCNPEKKRQIWVPEYQSWDIINNITNLPPQSLKTGGKVYIYADYLFQIELNEGIHVYKLDGAEYKQHTFLQIFGAQEISIRSNKLYTNNFEDLVSIDISDIQNVKVLDRIEKVFHLNFNLPPSKGYFECIDESKGRVVNWQLKEQADNICYY